MIYAVIDTNVFVAAFLSRHDDSATVRIMRALGHKKVSRVKFDTEIR